jgi:hypothetical protein
MIHPEYASLKIKLNFLIVYHYVSACIYVFASIAHKGLSTPNNFTGHTGDQWLF